jgi:hypothetical protein
MPSSSRASAGQTLKGTGRKACPLDRWAGGLALRANAVSERDADYPVFPGCLPTKKPGNAGLECNGFGSEDQLPTFT